MSLNSYLAVEYALTSFSQVVSGKHVKILSDNMCAVSYLQKMGGSHSKDCNAIANRIWVWCKEKDIWLTIAHIPGKLNVEADANSRKFNDATEWKLNCDIFQKLIEKVGKPDIDLFASRLNCQLKPCVSRQPDPEAVAVDAFTINWSGHFSYAFPPFSLIQRVLLKLERESADVLLVAQRFGFRNYYDF